MTMQPSREMHMSGYELFEMLLMMMMMMMMMMITTMITCLWLWYIRDGEAGLGDQGVLPQLSRLPADV